MDNEIADQTEIRLIMIRKALYRLYDHSLVALKAVPRQRNALVYLSLETPTRPVWRFITNLKLRILEKLRARL